MPITGPRADAIDKEIRQLKAGMFSGDFMRKPGQRAGPGPQEQKMIRSLTIAKMTPTEKAAFKERERKNAIAAASAKSFISAFKEGGANIKMLPQKYSKGVNVSRAEDADLIRSGVPVSKPLLSDKERIHRANTPAYAELQRLSLDDDNPDQWLNFFAKLPMREIRGLPIGKFRFRFDNAGNMIFVPWTRQAWENYYEHPQRGRWIPNQPFMYKCSPEWENHWINKYFAESENQRKRFGPRQFQHVWQLKAGDAICKKPKKSLWMKIRTPVVAAVAIVAAV